MNERVYADWNATAPPLAESLEAMRDAAARAWANPSSVHREGRAARALVDDAREAIAALVVASPRDVVLTSGGTEANNLALVRPFVDAEGAVVGGTLVTSRLEHPSIVAVAESLAARGVTVAWLPVGAHGAIDPADVERAFVEAGAGPRLVALGAANHETGVVQPVAAASRVAHAAGATIHVDAVQAVGKLDPGAFTGFDTLALTAHKLGGPKGVGALVTRPGVALRPILRGGAQERGLRPGTVDAVACAGFAAAARHALSGPARQARLAPLRDRVESALVAVALAAGHAVRRNGEGARAPHVTNLAFGAARADELVAALDLEGVAVSAGSACAAGTPEASSVIAAMSGREVARASVRISFGETSTADDAERLIRAFERVLGRGV